MTQATIVTAMSTALLKSRALLGLSAPAVRVEAHLPAGLPGFSTTGLKDTDVRERVKSAIQNSNFDFPRGRIVVNLGPAELDKRGGRYDLAIAAAILVASGQLPAATLATYDLLGELSLFGDVRGVRGALTALRTAGADNRKLLLPSANAGELTNARPDAVLEGVACISHLNGLRQPLRAYRPATIPPAPPANSALSVATREVPTTISATSAAAIDPDPLRDVVGQHLAKQALTIAAAGGHHMLMMGPPGAGKTMLAQRLARLLPPLPAQAAQEVAEIYSIAGLPIPAAGAPLPAPFRAPHHSASAAALAGGGSYPQPGEVTLAHRGILFLDELPEFRRDAIEVLREPLEAGSIRIARRAGTIEYPARFQMIAAMNPCPVGRACKPSDCQCSPEQANRYQNKISAPIRDRIDLHVPVSRVPISKLMGSTQPEHQPPGSKRDTEPNPAKEPSYRQIAAARATQIERGCLNAHLDMNGIKNFCQPDQAGGELLAEVATQLALSARAYYRTLRVARTIADLARKESIDEAAIATALSYRPPAPQ